MKERCNIHETAVGWCIRDAAGRMLTVTEVDDRGYRWCDCIKGKNKYLQKFTSTGQPLLNAAQDEYAVKVFPPREQKPKEIWREHRCADGTRLTCPPSISNATVIMDTVGFPVREAMKLCQVAMWHAQNYTDHGLLLDAVVAYSKAVKRLKQKAKK